ncbi:alpha/beta fold hydrolase [Wenxinia saemankumensis]|uniref:Lysophospholipase, alpha-beta hydrolase superfamily n=1 Tax=Wenxinia saemankumensis TaxID=1447782 RepID=A0A1M6FI85_9RHOB|nr:alpha/beta fold hydrolase [Wenxinia saemankumensis]SHI97458.1 Lysophospholipase, alpha-beta hydrolase superfamily [Wenxinia saemankumensis]
MDIALILVAGLALVAAAPFLREALRRGPDPAPSSDLVRTATGTLRRRWFGPETRGRVIVAIHGLTTPSDAFDALAEGLGQAGWRTLTFDHHGRGGSSNAAGAQDAAFYVRELDALLEAEGLGDDLVLMGYSMGGAIAAAYADAHPERVRRLILLAPAGLVPLSVPRWQLVPVIGDWLVRWAYPLRLRRGIRRGNEASAVPGLAAIQLRQTRRRGFAPAVLSSLRWLAGRPQEEEHRRLMKLNIPVLAIWGGADDVIPLRALGEMARFNRRAKQELVEGAGHGLPYTHPGEVAEYALAMLREGD